AGGDCLHLRPVGLGRLGAIPAATGLTDLTRDFSINCCRVSGAGRSDWMVVECRRSAEAGWSIRLSVRKPGEVAEWLKAAVC
ncbi:MAG: hypothetical protein ACE5K7_03165, partial [Phycisphaerae bacterium]